MDFLTRHSGTQLNAILRRHILANVQLLVDTTRGHTKET